jgi:alpha-tubulin suppressor-like RCC1 family protein
LSAGSLHTCARMADLTVRCWGNNGGGELGNGGTANASATGISNATQVAAGYFYSCARLADATLKCWGSNANGKLGNGNTTSSNTPVVVSNITTASDVATGRDHTCSRLTTGAVVCWGENSSGQMGNGTSSGTPQLLPGFVNSISNATAVFAGEDFSCARLSTAEIQCWGRGSDGQLGGGALAGSNVPVTVLGINNATSVSAGASHACARLSNSTVKCWGSNVAGQLGDGTTTRSATPVTVEGIGNATSVSAGNGFSCAKLSTGAVKCWGNNAGGLLGNGFGTIDVNAPQPVTGGPSCSLDIDGDGLIEATTDLLILSRVRMGLTDLAVTTGAVGTRATRASWPAIRDYLRFHCGMQGLSN